MSTTIILIGGEQEEPEEKGEKPEKDEKDEPSENAKAKMPPMMAQMLAKFLRGE